MPETPPQQRTQQPARDTRPTLVEALFTPTTFVGAVVVSVISGLLIQRITERLREGS